MKMALEEFGLRLKSDWVTPSSRCYRPPSWPPPRDWVVCEDRNGKILSRWGDSKWDLSCWAGKACTLRFDDEPIGKGSGHLDPANADLMRLLTTWRMWGPRAAATTSTLQGSFFNLIRPIVALCSREGIRASDLMRFPRVLEQIPELLRPVSFETVVTELHRLWDARDQIGFFLLDQQGIRFLSACRPDHEHMQTAYLPPRIWNYQLERLRSCLDDFLDHRRQVEDCFNFCVDAYAHNYHSLQGAMTSKMTRSRLPFRSPRSESEGIKNGYRNYGRFGLTAERFDIGKLLQKWVSVPDGDLNIRHFSRYLSLVQITGLAYIANFTLQRIGEVASLRADCLTWENDDRLGPIPIVSGETTKTDLDSDARWPTSPSVERAVTAMSAVARLRLRCAAAHPDIRPGSADLANPYLFDRSFEPWASGPLQPYSTRPYPLAYKAVLAETSLFDTEQLRITDDDLRTARMLTPNLSAAKGFEVGKVWPLSWHQLRRTGAVNMFASGLLSDSSMQFQMKHASRLMPLYYGRGYTKLHLNEDVESMVISAMYETMAHKLHSTMGDRFVSPHGDKRKEAILINLVGDKDVQTLAAAARRGQTTFREIRLGACTKRGHCSYGGVESVARCTGGDGDGPCSDALYDREKASEVEKELSRVDRELAAVPDGSPRHKALLIERNGLGNFLNVVRS